MQLCLIFTNPIIFLLTHPKIASSWCHNLLEDDNVNTSFFINDKFELSYTTEGLKENKDYFDKVQKDWNDFLNKRQDKKFIILYRNPIEHFLSAFMQENFYSETFDDYYFSEVFPKITYDINSETEDKNQFIEMFKNNRFEFNKKIISSFPEITKKVFKNRFEIRMENNSFESGHFSYWLSFIEKISNSSQFEHIDFKYIDIYEQDLRLSLNEELIKEVDMKSKLFSHKFSFDITKDILDESKYKELFYEKMEKEMIIYNKLKEMENE